MVKILLTNDDGYNAIGIQRATEALNGFADLTVVAPEKQQSAVSHKITLHKPLRMKSHRSSFAKIYSVSGSPVDCIKIALNQIFTDKKPDLIVSGINQGSNTGYNLFYSGTVAAAIEGMLNGIPSIAISLADHFFSDFSLSQEVLLKICKELVKNGLRKDCFLNINLPAITKNECKGIEFCQVSQNRYIEDFQVKKNPHGETYYWLGGKHMEYNLNKKGDDYLIKKNRVAIAPVQFDFNSGNILDSFKTWKI